MKIKALIIGFFLSFAVAVFTYAQQFNPESDFLVQRIGNSIIITRYVGTSQTVNIPPVIRQLSVTAIGDLAFSGKNVTHITIPDNVTAIGDRAFKNCKRLTSVIMSNSVTNIGHWAFYYCTSLNKVIIPNSVTNIGKGAFSNCINLTNITIPNSVTNIDDYAFFGTGLTKVTVRATIPPELAERVFTSAHSNLRIEVPSGSVNAYKTANGWNAYANKIIAMRENRETEETDKLTVGVNINPAGFMLSGPSVNVDFTKGSFNSEIYLIFPSLSFVTNNDMAGGFGFLGMFNYFWHSRIGGGYLGGGIGYIYTRLPDLPAHTFAVGANAGYKFLTKSGMYYRVGGFFGMEFVTENFESYTGIYFKPDMTIGYNC